MKRGSAVSIGHGRAGRQSSGKNPRENLQELRPQIDRRRPRQARARHPLYRTQLKTRPINQVVSLYRQVTMITERAGHAAGQTSRVCDLRRKIAIQVLDEARRTKKHIVVQLIVVALA